MYAAVSDGLGLHGGNRLDTAAASYTYLRNAVNAGLRAVQKDCPFSVLDKIVLALNTYSYTLGDSLVMPKYGELSGYHVEDHQDGKLYALRETQDIQEFSSNLVLTNPTVFRVEGAQLIVNSFNAPGDTLYIYGPGEITPITGSGSLIKKPSEGKERWAVVYYATWLIAVGRGDANRIAEYSARYFDITGKSPTIQGTP